MKWMKHNPSFLQSNERVEQFVVRTHELETLVRTLAENDGPANQHVLVVAPRGRGKTMLVHRLADELHRNDQLQASWTAVVFGEESYNISTVGEFWLEALLHIADATKRERWTEAYATVSSIRDEERLRETARARVLDYADETGGRLLLIVENLDTLIDTQISDDDAWVLRKTLQTEPRLMLLGTAVKRFEGMENPEKAMFEMFRRVDLGALVEGECRTLWEAISGNPVPYERAAALRVLTGGNPRLMVLLAQFATGASLSGMMRDLSTLIDEHTDYFKHNIEALSPKMRRVFLALADLWAPATSSEVAERGRLHVNETSSMLNRLVKDGRVEAVRKHGRTNEYQVSERLYNIYHLLRRRSGNAPRVRAFVAFVQHFYEPADIGTVMQRVCREALTRSDHAAHLELVSQLVQRSPNPEAKVDRLAAIPDAIYALHDLPNEIKETIVEPEILSRLAADAPQRWEPEILRALYLDRPVGAPAPAAGVVLARRTPGFEGSWWILAEAGAWHALSRAPLPNNPACIQVSAQLALLNHTEPWAARLLANAKRLAPEDAFVRLSSAYHLRRLDLVTTELLGMLCEAGSYRTYVEMFINLCVEQGEIRKANELVEQALATQPETSLFRFAAYRLAHLDGDEAGLKAARAWVDAHPDDLRAHLNLAGVLFATDPPTALAKATSLAEHHPNSPAAQNQLGVLLLGSGKKAKASAAFRAGRARRPDYALWDREAFCYLPDDLDALRVLIAEIPRSRLGSVASLLRVLTLAEPEHLAMLRQPIVDLVHAPRADERSALSSVLMRIGDVDGALETIRSNFEPDAVQVYPSRASNDLMRLAASGHAAEALNLLFPETTPLIEPIVIALKQLVGEPVCAAPEILEVAQHVRHRIEHLRLSGAVWYTDPNTLPITAPESF